MTLTPAYGRDYRSAKAVKADWNEGKDFIIADLYGGNAGRYANKQDLADVRGVFIRYAHLTKIVKVQ